MVFCSLPPPPPDPLLCTRAVVYIYISRESLGFPERMRIKAPAILLRRMCHVFPVMEVTPAFEAGAIF